MCFNRNRIGSSWISDMKPPTFSFVPHGCAIHLRDGCSEWRVARRNGPKPMRVLLVAHPDDEYEVAGTVYRISKELGNLLRYQ
jgi:hypothetical protein